MILNGTILVISFYKFLIAVISDCAGKHSAPIWQLCWIERDKGVGDERGEILVSISADGRIVQWSIRKGFECTGKYFIV